ncbi:hypothetical protein ACGF13_08105 [Kitasatospora sp. NPDC048286]
MSTPHSTGTALADPLDLIDFATLLTDEEREIHTLVVGQALTGQAAYR